MTDYSSVPPSSSGHWKNAILIGLIYSYIVAVALGALWFFRFREQVLPWWTDIPVGLFAIALIGPAQHRLLLLGQEACLGILFKNRFWNDFIGDWLLHFPFSTCTSQMRHVVRGHYEFTNDHERDPELIITQKAGFIPFKLGRLLRLSSLLKWNSLRANYYFAANPRDPYQGINESTSRVAFRLGSGYVLIMFAILIGLYLSPNWWVLVIAPPSMWAITCLVFLFLPKRYFHHSKLQNAYSSRFRTLMQITFITLVNLGLGWCSFLTGRSGILNYIALWVAPMVTTCAWSMLIRYTRQHEAHSLRNLEAGWLRKVLVLPLNSHLHQTKHEFPATPWYDLPQFVEKSPTDFSMPNPSSRVE